MLMTGKTTVPGCMCACACVHERVSVTERLRGRRDYVGALYNLLTFSVTNISTLANLLTKWHIQV